MACKFHFEKPNYTVDVHFGVRMPAEKQKKFCCKTF